MNMIYLEKKTILHKHFGSLSKYFFKKIFLFTIWYKTYSFWTPFDRNE